MQGKKLTLSKETLRTLDDSDLTGVVGGRPSNGLVCVESVVCNSAACNVDVDVNSTICNSGVCNSVACDSVLLCKSAIC